MLVYNDTGCTSRLLCAWSFLENEFVLSGTFKSGILILPCNNAECLCAFKNRCMWMFYSASLCCVNTVCVCVRFWVSEPLHGCMCLKLIIWVWDILNVCIFTLVTLIRLGNGLVRHGPPVVPFIYLEQCFILMVSINEPKSSYMIYHPLVLNSLFAVLQIAQIEKCFRDYFIVRVYQCMLMLGP